MAGWPKGLTNRRRLLVGRYWLRGYSEREIAEKVREEAAKSDGPLARCANTTQHTVHNDIAACREGWITYSKREFGEAQAEQVARLLDTIHLAHVDYEQCQRGHTVKEKKTDGTVITKRYDSTWGMKPTHLRVALQAEELLARILGTLAPTQLTGAGGDDLIPDTYQVIYPNGIEVIPGRMSGNGHDPEATEASLHGNGDNPDT